MDKKIVFASLTVAALGVSAAIAAVVFRKPPHIEVHVPLAEILEMLFDEDEEEDILPYDVFLGPVDLTDKDYKILKALDFDASNDVE